MKRHLNTLFITTEDAWLVKQGEAVAVRVDNETRLRIPVQNLGSIVCFGRVLMTQPAMAQCGAQGIPIALLTRHGRFLARITGPTRGNVLLRREQYHRADSPGQATPIARNIVAAKIANARAVLLRRLRDAPDCPGKERLRSAADALTDSLAQLPGAGDVDGVRGIEGEAAATYFRAFPHLFTAPDGTFKFEGRTRRPATDPVNALLSFLYAMATHDAEAACETVGLDPQVGFLHAERPGRPALALDLVEEFRAFLADRLTLSLVNRGQVRPEGFRRTESGAVEMTDETRKAVLTAYQKRKQATITHPFLREKTTIGLLVHLQARLLTRHLRGDLDAYPPFLWK